MGGIKQSCRSVFWDLVTEFNFPVRKERRAAPRVERGREKNGIERRAKGARLARRCDCHDSFQNTFECAHPPSLLTNYARVTENRSICMSICPVEKLSRQLQFMVLQSAWEFNLFSVSLAVECIFMPPGTRAHAEVSKKCSFKLQMALILNQTFISNLVETKYRSFQSPKIGIRIFWCE